MPWFWDRPATNSDASSNVPSSADQTRPTSSSSLASHLLTSLYSPTNLVSTTLLTTLALGSVYVYRTRLRRIRNIDHLPPRNFHSSITRHPRPLFGHVLTVPDGDGLRFYHTPGGRLLCWDWIRKVPTSPFPRNDKKNTTSTHTTFLTAQTLSIRLSGIDAPEGAHFGKQAQPYAAEALSYLREALLGRRVRLYPHSKDQYGRVVGTILVRPLGGLGLGVPAGWQRDVGLEMVARGLATVYEAKSGSEFGGAKREAALWDAQKRAKKGRKGMWSLQSGSAGAEEPQESSGGWLAWVGSLFRSKRADQGVLETPREYKRRMKGQEQQQQPHSSNRK